jgi:hypothetical protein
MYTPIQITGNNAIRELATRSSHNAIVPSDYPRPNFIHNEKKTSPRVQYLPE